MNGLRRPAEYSGNHSGRDTGQLRVDRGLLSAPIHRTGDRGLRTPMSLGVKLGSSLRLVTGEELSAHAAQTWTTHVA